MRRLPVIALVASLIALLVPAVAAAVPLGKRWERDLRDTIGTPVVADGRVFLVTGEATTEPNRGQQLRALALDSGEELWSRAIENTRGAEIALDGGKVIVREGPQLRAYATANGDLQWTVRPEPGGRSSGDSEGPRFLSGPAAFAGEVYAVGTTPPGPAAPLGGSAPGATEPSELSLYALRASDGAVLRTTPTTEYHDGAAHGVAADDDQVFVASSCSLTESFDRRTFEAQWEHRSSSSSGCTNATRPPRPGNGEVLVASGVNQYTILDAASGTSRGAVEAHSAPAFAPGLALLPQASALDAQARPGGLNRWSWRPPGTTSAGPSGSPVVHDGDVFVRSERYVRALRAGDGGELWKSFVRYSYASTDELPEMASGDGHLLVPYGSYLTAFWNGPDSPGLSTRPPLEGDAPMTLRTNRNDVAFGQAVLLSGHVPTGDGAKPEGHDVALEQDPWPYEGNFERVATRQVGSGGQFAFGGVEPERNTRYRAVIDFYADAVTEPVEVRSDYGILLRPPKVRRGRVLVRADIVHSPLKRMAGRRMHVYLVRGRRAVRKASPRLRRVSATRVRAATSYRLRRLRRGDRTLVCVPERADDGYGRVYRIERLCGRRVIPRGSLTG